MEVTLPLEKMTIEEKLRLMESIWVDLAKPPDVVQSPVWHEEELAKRQARLERGETNFVDWQEAKERIRERAHANRSTQ